LRGIAGRAGLRVSAQPRVNGSRSPGDGGAKSERGGSGRADQSVGRALPLLGRRRPPTSRSAPTLPLARRRASRGARPWRGREAGGRGDPTRSTRPGGDAEKWTTRRRGGASTTRPTSPARSRGDGEKLQGDAVPDVVGEESRQLEAGVVCCIGRRGEPLRSATVIPSFDPARPRRDPGPVAHAWPRPIRSGVRPESTRTIPRPRLRQDRAPLVGPAGQGLGG
jgi:hypothetical protein